MKTIEAFGALLIFFLGLGAYAKEDKAVYDPVERIVVVGDLHGDFESFKEVLESAKLIDSKLRWKGGRTHLVQLGDIPDRGPDTSEIIEFILNLQRRAARAGGKVHILIGNHDAMNVYGDLRYVHTKEFEAFATRNSQRLLERLFNAELDWIKRNSPEEEWPVFDDAYRMDWFKERPLGFVEHRQSWSPAGEIGKWVRSRNVVLKIGDTLFVHAGISPHYLGWSIDEINRAAREELAGESMVEPSILQGQEGPLWYRGMATGDEAALKGHTQAVLEHFGVKRIVVGHTPTPGFIVPRFGGRVIMADVGLSEYYGGNIACLEIVQGRVYAIHRGGRIELPGEGDDAFVDYLENIRAIEPTNEQALRWIERLEKRMPAEVE